MATKEQVLQALSSVQDPELHRSLTELNMVREVEVQGGTVSVTIALTVPHCPLRRRIEADVRAALEALPGVEQVNVNMTAMTERERQAVLGGAPPVGVAAARNCVDRVVAVMSGKGGVGKSAVTALLATALARAGYRVGVLDADVTGPSIPKLFGLRGPIESGPEGMLPLRTTLGIKVISANLLVESEDMPLIWRGPMIGKAIQQLWGDVLWEDLDYLLVDMPPGTSDVALTVMQSLPLNGILMVTTPQSLAAMIVRKAVNMAHLLKVPIVGVVENMAYFPCAAAGEPHLIFGPSHAAEVAQAADAPLLAQLPLDPSLAPHCDAGTVETVSLPAVDELLRQFLARVPVAA